LRGALPKIGIRPAIDGRRKGVRESLENQTMEMAQHAARIFTEGLRHSNGLPVECVIADTCIGGVAEAAETADKFAREGVGVSLTVSPCWCYGAETMDMDPLTPKAVWGFNGTERPGAVYLAAVLAAHNQKGLPAFGIYRRDVQDKGEQTVPPDVEEKLLQFAKVALALAEMKGKSYLSLGSVSMGIAGSMLDASFFQSYLGMRNESVDMSELVRRIDERIYDPEEFQRALEWVKEYCPEGKDYNPTHLQAPPSKKDDDWQTVVKMTLITRDLMVGNPRLSDLGYGEEALGHNAIAAGFQGQRQWTDHFPNGDFMEALLNSSFDWNGIRESFIIATENDALNGATMLFGNLLTGTAQVFADVRTYWSPDAVRRVTGKSLTGRAAEGIIHLINSGAASLDACGEQMRNGERVFKPFWEITAEEATRCLDATTWCAANTGYFRGGGFSSCFVTKGEIPVTMARLNLVYGLGPVLQIAEGYAVELPQEIHDSLSLRTDPSWPTTWFAPNLTGEGPFTDVYSVMNNWGANHGAFSYGHVGGLLISLAAALRIPVSMHNVPQRRVFRPGVWGAFGTQDSEGADYRACLTLGPLYGRK